MTGSGLSRGGQCHGAIPVTEAKPESPHAMVFDLQCKHCEVYNAAKAQMSHADDLILE